MVIFIWILLITALLAIIFEEKLQLNKAKSCLFLGGLSWIMLFVAGTTEETHLAFDEAILEIAVLWLFLISAMSIISILEKRYFLEKLFLRLLPGEKISERKLLYCLGLGIFCLSAVADNVTATIIAIALLSSLNVQEESLIPIAFSLVYAANAGGVGLITGDVTTLMIEQSGHVHQSQIIWMIIPSIISTLLLFYLTGRNLHAIIDLNKQNLTTRHLDNIIAIIFLLTIIGVVCGHIFLHIPPVLSFLFGLSVVWLSSWIHKAKNGEDIDVIGYVKHVEFEALFFFLGILLVVGALKYVGGLVPVTELFEIVPEYLAIFIVGCMSAVLDNVPLTAVLIKSAPEISEAHWLVLTYAVGVGGSLLIFGSAAGVVAMAKCKQLTFRSTLPYVKPVFVSMSTGFVLCIVMANIVA